MKFQATIIKYYPDDLNFNQEEDYEWFYKILLKILYPKTLQGYEIYVFLEENTMEENPWKLTG